MKNKKKSVFETINYNNTVTELLKTRDELINENNKLNQEADTYRLLSEVQQSVLVSRDGVLTKLMNLTKQSDLSDSEKLTLIKEELDKL